MSDIAALNFEERFGLLVDRELTERDNRRLTTRLRQAKLRQTACIEDIDYRHPRALENRNHVTTPLDRRLSTEQTITVTDPRHPLCGRTLTLIAMTYHPELGQCCVVWLRPQVVRLVPVSATHVAFDPNAISPTPLSVDAVAQLLRVVQDIQHVSQG